MSISSTSFDLRKLSEPERDVLARIYLDADVTHKKVASELGIRPSTVSSIIDRFLGAGFIVRRPLVDMGTLGLVVYHLLATTSSEATRKQVLGKIATMDGVYFIQETSGPATIFAGYATSPSRGIRRLFAGLEGSLGYQLVERQIGRVELNLFYGRKYLSSNVQPKPLAIGPRKERVRLSEVDVTILSAICQSSRTSIEAISRHTKLPASTVKFRLNRLAEHKVIAGYVYAFTGVPRGYIWARLLIRLHGGCESAEAVERVAAAHPHVSSLVAMTGPWDFELGVEVENPSTIHELISDLEDAMKPATAIIHILPVLSTLMPVRFPFKKLKVFERHLE